MRRLLVALAASAAIHLGFLAVLVLLAEPVLPPAARGPPIAIELWELPALPVPGAPPAGAPVRPGAGTRREPPRSSPSDARPGGAMPGSAVTRDDGAEGVALAPSETAPDLRVRPPRWSTTEPPPASGDTAVPGDALREWAGDVKGRSRVESGLVHPYYRDVGRTLLRAWDAERAVEKRGLSGYLAQAGDNLRNFGRVWHRMARGYAGTGSPTVIDGSSARMKDLSGLPGGAARDALVETEIRRQLHPAFSEGHVTTVRVTQGTDGHLLSVELVSPSRDAEIDRAALADVRAAAKMLPFPPPEALAGRTRLVSLWELEIEVSITPPIPVIELEFDEVLGLTDVRLPLDRRIRKRVRLVAAD